MVKNKKQGYREISNRLNKKKKRENNKEKTKKKKKKENERISKI